MERSLEDVVHDWGAANPEFLASGWKDSFEILLVPAGASLARESDDQVEVLRVHLLEEAEHAEAAGLFLVEVGHVVSELEVVLNLGLFFFFHFAHNESCNVGGEIHESNCTSAGSKSKVIATGIASGRHAERFAHWSFDHPGGTIISSGALEHSC